MLLQELRKFPAFNNFEKAVKKNLTIDNYYVNHFAPEKEGYYDEKDDNGRQVCCPYKLSDEQVEEEAIENLLEDKTGYFDEVVTEQLSSEVVELVRALIKEIRR